MALAGSPFVTTGRRPLSVCDDVMTSLSIELPRMERSEPTEARNPRVRVGDSVRFPFNTGPNPPNPTPPAVQPANDASVQLATMLLQLETAREQRAAETATRFEVANAEAAARFDAANAAAAKREQERKRTDAAARSEADRVRLLQKPLETPCFTGADDVEWDSWIYQFELEVTERGHAPATWGNLLVRRITKEAARIVGHLVRDLPKDDPTIFELVKSTMSTRYGSKQKQTEFENQASKMKQGSDEAYSAYHSRAEYVVRNAHAGEGLPVAYMEKTLINCIRNGYYLDDVRLAMSMHATTSFREFCEATMRLDTNLTSSNPKRKVIMTAGTRAEATSAKRAAAVIKQSIPVEDASGDESEGDDHVRHIHAAVQASSKEGGASRPAAPRKSGGAPQKAGDWSRAICFNCNKKGHRARECPETKDQKRINKEYDKFLILKRKRADERAEKAADKEGDDSSLKN